MLEQIRPGAPRFTEHDLAARGVHLYPVAASGAGPHRADNAGPGPADGRSVPLFEDDSGIGDSHAVPRVPCFFVTKLDAAILRMVDIELTGQYRGPDPADDLRTGGDPQSGRCALADGSQANVF